MTCGDYPSHSPEHEFADAALPSGGAAGLQGRTGVSLAAAEKTFTSRFRTLRDRLAELWRRVAAHHRTTSVTKGLQSTLLVGVLVFLVAKLSAVGWGEVMEALPTSPLFYGCFLLRYFAAPLSEIPAYELVWRRSLWTHISAFLRKRVYNYSVLGYSGEAFFALWARRRLDLSDRDIMVGIKDNNLISALVSNVMTVGLVALLGATGMLGDGLRAFPGASVLFAIAFVTALALSLAVLAFRRKLIDLPRGVMPKLIGLHGARAAFVAVLQIGMYAAAIPGVSPMAWLIFISLQLVLSRIPFTPNQDIVYLTAALHLANAVGAPPSNLAGMLVAEAGLSQALNFAFFVLTIPLARATAAPKSAAT
jgi:hypothetical protein